MDNANFRISLDIHEINSQVTLHVKKGDTARKILTTLTEAGRPYRITEDCMAVFTAEKPDESILYNGCAIQGNRIEYAMTQQTCALAGELNCEIRLYGAGGALITSPRFIIIVDDTVYSDGDVVDSSSEFTALTELVVQARELIAAYEAWLEEAKISYATEEQLKSLKNVVGGEEYLTLLKAASVLEAVYALRQDVGTLSELDTKERKSLVAAINGLFALRTAEDVYQAQTMRAFAYRAQGVRDGDSIAVPVINSMDGIEGDMGLAYIRRSVAEEETPDADGTVTVPTEGRVRELILELTPVPDSYFAGMDAVIGISEAAELAALDATIGG